LFELIGVRFRFNGAVSHRVRHCTPHNAGKSDTLTMRHGDTAAVPVSFGYQGWLVCTAVFQALNENVIMKKLLWLCILVSMSATAQNCPYDPRCVNNPYGAGSPYNPNSINNPYGPYGSPYSKKSANNPYATDAPKLYDSAGNYRGRLSANPYDPDSTSNPYGRYGSRYSPDSINNPYGAGNPYNPNPIYVVPSQ